MKSYWLSTLFLLIAIPVTLVMGVALGSAYIPANEVFHIILEQLSGNETAPSPNTTIVWQLRLPRVLLAFVVGGGLSLVGVAMQTLVRNPLAEPYILGLANGASAGASLFYLGFLPPVFTAALTLPLAAFLGSFITMVLVLMIAYKDSELQITRLLLAGVAISALMGAINTFATFASDDLDEMKTLMFWLMGSFSGTLWSELPLPLGSTLISLIFLLLLHRPLDALLLGEESAFHLGIPVQTFRWILIIISTLVTGILVASSGAIGFIGLIVPHSIRSIFGVLHRHVIPFSFFAGGIFTVWADIAARTVLTGEELPLGMVTALCGAPFFLWLIRKNPYRFGQ